MNARTLAALALSAAVGAFAFAPIHAQDAVPASSSTAMSHDAMPSRDAMHSDAMKMKPDAMKHDAMTSRTMHHDGMMKQDGAMKMKKDDAMKMRKDDAMKPAAGDAMSSGG